MKAVIDASLVGHQTFNKARISPILKAISDKQLLALSFLRVEFAQIVWKHHKFGNITLDQAKSALDAIHRLPIAFIPDEHLLSDAFLLAADKGNSLFTGCTLNIDHIVHPAEIAVSTVTIGLQFRIDH